MAHFHQLLQAMIVKKEMAGSASFFTGWMPFLCQTNSIRALKDYTKSQIHNFILHFNRSSALTFLSNVLFAVNVFY